MVLNQRLNTSGTIDALKGLTTPYSFTTENDYKFLYSEWSSIINVTNQTRNNVTIGWDPRADNAAIEYHRMFALLPGSTWYGDYYANLDEALLPGNDHEYKSTFGSARTLAQRRFVLSDAQEEVLPYESRIVTAVDNRYESPWCTGTACTTPAQTVYPKQDLTGQEIKVFVSMVINGDLYFEQVPQSVYAANIPEAT